MRKSRPISRQVDKNRVYNPAPAHQPNRTEGKKTKYEAAEFDEEFIERMNQMEYEEFLAHLQSLPEPERKAVMQALDRAISQRVLQAYVKWLTSGAGF